MNISKQLRLLATESSIHTLRISATTVSDRVVYVDTSQKMKLLGARYQGITMPNKIQPREQGERSSHRMMATPRVFEGW